jgi:hypothetical protein
MARKWSAVSRDENQRVLGLVEPTGRMSLGARVRISSNSCHSLGHQFQISPMSKLTRPVQTQKFCGAKCGAMQPNNYKP